MATNEAAPFTHSRTQAVLNKKSYFRWQNIEQQTAQLERTVR